MELFKDEVVAIAGPQTTVVSHFVAHIAEAVRVPLVSFSATDPALSEYQYAHFICLTHSDFVQMAAIAGVINYYGWREVVALFTDDENGIDVLGDLLNDVGAKFTYKAAMHPAIDRYGIGSILAQIAQMESRIFVLHMLPTIGRIVLLMANYLKMVTTDYVWIVTDAITGILDTEDVNTDILRATQDIPDSPRLKSYVEQRSQGIGTTLLHVNPYELYSYDSIWMIAYALDDFLGQGGSLDFIPPLFLHDPTGGNSDLAKLRILKDGPTLLEFIQKTNFSGITGFVQIDKHGDLIDSFFESVNMVGKLCIVGYWRNETGCSLFPPSGANVFSNISHSNGSNNVQKLQDVILLGGSAQVTRGGVVPKNRRPLLIGVPNKTGYK